ncbi:MAG: short-chain alcohol dehydrogenase [Acidimicrobiales bacterium]|nr:short-chain alcohol dehydrogenase [Acidimicrobiales bacterium]
MTVPASPPTGAALAGRRVLVVGASAGIGRSFAAQAIRAGADVVVAARRLDRLVELTEAAGPCTAMALDVTSPDDLAGLRDALAAGPALDVLLYAVGSAPLVPLADTTVADWEALLRTNVIGFSEVVRTARPHLSRTAVVAALSSEAVDAPKHAVAAYAASKAALEGCIRGWRLEHPGLRFSCIRVGGTSPTEFGQAFDGEVLGRVIGQWISHGLLQEELMPTDDVGAVLLESLGVLLAHPGVSIDDLVLRSPSAVAGAG